MKKETKNSAAAGHYDGKMPYNKQHAVVDEDDVMRVRQTSRYQDEKCAPDNNPFFEERSNPLSSKGN